MYSPVDVEQANKDVFLLMEELECRKPKVFFEIKNFCKIKANKYLGVAEVDAFSKAFCSRLFGTFGKENFWSKVTEA